MLTCKCWICSSRAKNQCCIDCLGIIYTALWSSLSVYLLCWIFLSHFIQVKKEVLDKLGLAVKPGMLSWVLTVPSTSPKVLMFVSISKLYIWLNWQKKVAWDQRALLHFFQKGACRQLEKVRNLVKLHHCPSNHLLPLMNDRKVHMIYNVWHLIAQWHFAIFRFLSIDSVKVGDSGLHLMLVDHCRQVPDCHCYCQCSLNFCFASLGLIKVYVNWL